MAVRQDDYDALQAEHAALQERIAMLQQRLAEVEQHNTALSVYKSLFEALPINALIYEPGGVVVDANPQNETTMGIPPAAIIGKFNILDDSEAAEKGYADHFQRTLEGHVSRMQPTMHTISETGGVETRDNHMVWLETFFFPLYDEKGAVRHVVQMSLDITDRIQSEERLYLAQFAMDRAADSIYLVDEDGRISYVNDAACNDLGYTCEELMSLKISDIDTQLSEAGYKENWKTWSQHNDGAVTLETYFHRKDGSTFPVEISYNFVEFNGKGYIFSFARDMSQRKEADKKLRENEERLKFILEGSSDGAWDTNLVTYDAYLSPRYEEMLGYDLGELEQSVTGWLSLIHPDDIDIVNREFQVYLEEHTPTYLAERISIYEVEHRLLHKSGEWRWMLSRGKVVMFDDNGTPTRMTGTITDVTDRKRLEENLRTFKAAFDNAADAISIIRISDSVMTYYNEAQRQQYGCGDTYLGESVAVRVAPEEQEEFSNILQEVVEQGSWKGQLTHIRQNGTRFPVLESCFTIIDNDGNAESMVSIVRDITEMVEAEAERAALHEQMIEAQRAAISELSTPLLPLAENVIAMPLVGTIDSNRAQLIMEALLDGIARYQADIAIVDITGVRMVDTQVAQAIVRTAQAVTLLGARVILTGIQPQIAQTLVHLGADMENIITRSTLQSGIDYAMKERFSNGSV